MVPMPTPVPEWTEPLPAPVLRDGVRSYLGVPYASTPGYRALRLDAHVPADATGPVPVVVFFHGGSFVMGRRDRVTAMFTAWQPSFFAQLPLRGIAMISAEYRLSKEAIWPAALHDAAAALRYVAARADDLGVDPGRLATWGESAGARLATMTAFLQDQPDRLGTTGAPVAMPRVRAVVDWCGAVDLNTPLPETSGVPAPHDVLLGAPAATVPDRVREASPIFNIHGGIPPVLILHGTDDIVTPVTEAIRFAEALRGAGVDVTSKWFDGVGHVWVGSADAARMAVDVTADFLLQHLLD